MVASMSAAASACPPRNAARPSSAVGREVAAGRIRRDLKFPDQGGCAGQITREQHRDRTHIEGQRQLAERTDAAGKPDVPVGMQVPATVIPEVRRDDAGYPVAAQLLVDRHADAEDVQRPPQYRQSGRISPVEVRCEAFQKKVGGARGCRGGGAVPAARATSSTPPPRAR